MREQGDTGELERCNYRDFGKVEQGEPDSAECIKIRHILGEFDSCSCSKT